MLAQTRDSSSSSSSSAAAAAAPWKPPGLRSRHCSLVARNIQTKEPKDPSHSGWLCVHDPQAHVAHFVMTLLLLIGRPSSTTATTAAAALPPRASMDDTAPTARS